MLISKNKTSVFPISLGGAGIGSCDGMVFFQGPVSIKNAVDTVQYALESGINLIDTSPFYGNSETKIGIALSEFGNRESVILSTKAGTHPTLKGYTKECFERSIENSLTTLKTDYLDVVHIHDPSDADFKTVMEAHGGIEALVRLKEQGVIRNIGLGVREHHIHQEFIMSGYADVILPYLDYNLLNTSAGEILQKAGENTISVMMGSPLCMGLLSGTNPTETTILHYDIEKDVSRAKAIQMYEWCQINSVNLMALNYRFILNHPAVNTVVIGASSKEEIKTSLTAYNTNTDQVMDSFLEEFMSLQ